MSKLVDILSHMFFPNRCMFCDTVSSYDTVICDRCKQSVPYADDTQIDCTNHSFDTVVSAFYYESGADTAIINLKFHGIFGNARKLAVYMQEALISSGLNETADILIPIPMHEKDVAARGFNQSELLCKELSKLLFKPYKTGILRKIKQTKKQHELTADERALNLSQAFTADSRMIRDKTVMLVDDVFTTGSTMEACARVLKGAGAERIICVTAAKTRLNKDEKEGNYNV